MKFVAPLMIASGLLLAAATAHATVLANAAGDYNSESLGQMTALPDTDNSGNWLYYMGETDNETTPTSIIRKTVLTYEADPNYQGDFYGTTSSYTFSGTQSSGYELPGVDNSMIFNNNYFPASPGYIEMHPGDAEDATLLEWTAGATETGPVSIAFDLERPNGSGSVNFSVYDDGFQIYELSNITSGSTTDTLDEVIARVPRLTSLCRVTRAALRAMPRTSAPKLTLLPSPQLTPCSSAVWACSFWSLVSAASSPPKRTRSTIPLLASAGRDFCLPHPQRWSEHGDVVREIIITHSA
jgi:hypothetical protein